MHRRSSKQAEEEVSELITTEESVYLTHLAVMKFLSTVLWCYTFCIYLQRRSSYRLFEFFIGRNANCRVMGLTVNTRICGYSNVTLHFCRPNVCRPDWTIGRLGVTVWDTETCSLGHLPSAISHFLPASASIPAPPPFAVIVVSKYVICIAASPSSVWFSKPFTSKGKCSRSLNRQRKISGWNSPMNDVRRNMSGGDMLSSCYRGYGWH